MSGIFTHDNAPDTPRSPYKRPSSAVPQSTENLLHFNGETYKVPFKPSRRPSQTTLSGLHTLSSSSGSPPPSRPQSAASMVPTSSANSRGMKDVMHHTSSTSSASAVASPRKVRISPGGPTSIILG